MRGKSTRGTTANPPRTSSSPGTIRRYMVNDGSKESPSKSIGATAATGTKNKTPDRAGKAGTRRQMADGDIRPLGSDTGAELVVEPLQDRTLPTKEEIAEMFARLEVSIKEEINIVHENMSHLLKRVEEVESTVETQGAEIQKMKLQMEAMQVEQRNIKYRLEDQENRNRRKNPRIRGLPEPQDGTENLPLKMEEIFNDLMNPTEAGRKLKLDRVHRLRKPPDIRGDSPRDVIVRFHNFADKEQITSNLKRNLQAKYKDTNLQIFQDLAAETLKRRRIQKPLLATLKAHGVQYSWGFPACLIGRKEGRKAVLRFPEDTQKFCEHLEIPLAEIPGWWEKNTKNDPIGETPTWRLVGNLQ